MPRDDYTVARLVGVRAAGVAFDVLDRLGTPALAEAARRVHAAADELDRCAERAAAQAGDEVADRNLRSRIRRQLDRRTELAPERFAAHPWLAPYGSAFSELHRAWAELEQLVAASYAELHAVVLREASRELPDFLAYESEGLTDLDAVAASSADASTGKLRKVDRALALYLQRVCAKNDTISRFGPSAWARVVGGDGVWAATSPKLELRCCEVERWVVNRMLELIDAEPDARAEARPRLHPNGCFDGDAFVRHDEDRTITLAGPERQLAARCDGRTPAHALADDAGLRRLVELGVIVWRIERFAVDTSPFASLWAEIDSWRAGPLRERWRGHVATIDRLAKRFAEEAGAAARRAVLGELHGYLAQIGIAPPRNERTLYAARNPINENCVAESTFTIGGAAVARLLGDAWPWFDLFRDVTAYAATRAFHRLREVVVAAPRRAGRLSFATLARVARQHGLVLETDRWISDVVAPVYAEIRGELSGLLAKRADATEWQITPEECGFLRQRHAFPLGGELSYPSADLQVVAASEADARAGRFDWVVAELHYGVCLLQHGMHWACPDKPSLYAAARGTFGGDAFLVRDSFTELPVQNSGEALFAAMTRPTFVGTLAAKPAWHTCSPADAEVIVDEARCDIRLRGNGTDLGSLIRTPRLHMSMHPFVPFQRPPHEPRLRLGSAVVQRQAWYVTSAALGAQRATGVSGSFVAAIERLRAERGIPRWVFVRPAPEALRERGVFFGRDKDNKPLYVDLESVVFLDILERRLRKYGTLVLTEMLPDPHHIAWRSPEGRYSFELRTMLVPPRPE